MAICWESFRARYFAATALAAPVRIAVTHAQSMTLRGIPVSGSFKMSSPSTYGNPLSRFGRYRVTHLIPATFARGTYPGIALMADSGIG